MYTSRRAHSITNKLLILRIFEAQKISKDLDACCECSLLRLAAGVMLLSPNLPLE